MNHTNEGSKLYLYSITSVAILGGLLFGYDTAVISGAEKGLEAFFLTATDFQYDKVMHGITSPVSGFWIESVTLNLVTIVDCILWSERIEILPL